MLLLLLLTLATGGLPTVDSADFPAEAQAAALQATVRIQNVTRGEQGSGVVLGRSGPFVYFLTANHVVDGARELEIQTFSARSYPKPANVYRSAEVLARSPRADLAVLRLATSDPLPGTARLCPAARVPTEKGFPVLTTGCDNGKPPTCRVDTVRAPRRLRKPGEDENALYWELGHGQAKGRSGGPLLDRRGRLLGIASGSSGGKGYYTHIEEIHAFLAQNALDWLAEEDH